MKENILLKTSDEMIFHGISNPPIFCHGYFFNYFCSFPCKKNNLKMSSKIGELTFFVYFLSHIYAPLLVNKEKHLSKAILGYLFATFVNIYCNFPINFVF